jgi:hypothetical protein
MCCEQHRTSIHFTLCRPKEIRINLAALDCPTLESQSIIASNALSAIWSLRSCFRARASEEQLTFILNDLMFPTDPGAAVTPSPGILLCVAMDGWDERFAFSKSVSTASFEDRQPIFFFSLSFTNAVRTDYHKHPKSMSHGLFM